MRRIFIEVSDEEYSLLEEYKKDHALTWRGLIFRGVKYEEQTIHEKIQSANRG